MNLIFVGGACVGALFLGVKGLELVKATASERAIPAPAERISAVAAEDPEQSDFMTRNFSVDPKTGETTETSVIGFAD